MRPNNQQSPMNQGNPAFGQGFDPRFNQANQRPQMNPNVRQQMLNAMLQQMPPHMRENFQNLPADKVNEMLAKWTASRGGQVPGRPQAQPGQFGQGNNPMAQFAQGNNPNMPQPNGAAGANGQNPMMVQQQLNRMRNTQGQPQMPNNPQAMNFMNNMDVPQRVLSQLQNIPPEIKKWGQLKQWIPTQPLPQNVGEQLLAFQLQQFRAMLVNKPQLAQAAGIQMPQPGQPAQQPPQGVGAPGATGPPPQVAIPPQLAAAFANIQVTAHEIETARRHDRFKTWDEAKIRSYLVQMKQHQIRQKFGMQMPGQAPQFAQQPAGAAAPPTQQPPAGPGAMPRGPNAGNEAPPAAAPARNSTQGQPRSNRPTPQQQNASPAVPPKNNLKRPSTDDAADVPNNASSTPMQRPPSQQAPPPTKPPILNQAQLASLPPDQRAKYEQLMRNHRAAAQQQPTPSTQEDIERLRQIGAEEQRASNNEQLQDVLMNPEQHADMTTKIQRMVFEMSKLGRALGRWYSLTRDDNRARMFFRMRMRLVRQFKDGEKMTTPKEVFSVKPKDLEQVRAMMESIAKDLAASFPQAVRKTASQQNAADGAAQQTTPGQTSNVQPAQQVPLNAANLEKNSQALNKMHQRSSVTPAAPTTSQPPFPLGAPSPHGLPAYGKAPAVTADNLHLPTSRKKPKTTASASVSPQVSKQASPQMQKQAQSAEMKAVPKAQFQCAMPDCEANSIGFATKEASQAHYEEEHVKPFEDPTRYATENLAFALGLDANGKSTAMAPAAGLEQGASPAGAASMAREASMKRSESSNGARPGVAKGVPGKPAEQQNADATMVKTEGQTPAQSNNMDFGFGMNTIDPQELFQFGLESGGGGAIMDMGVYRSITPNDTPESSKDSASSEPNSDVSEGATLDVRLDLGLDNWQPFDGDAFVNTGAMDMEMSMFDGAQPMGMDNTALAGFTSWDDVNPDFTKPFTLDTSLYSLDTSS
ncbi:hypothetical protein PG997_015400 [Apiospora hydei]|uniref:Mediator of RNA polymerase II transcription subunit 15 n=1 Tax=Apiospora hydei TaxID=1337664 RepID=A0ABR1UQH9_9PEZI